jgi:hypothetical protein
MLQQFLTENYHRMNIFDDRLDRMQQRVVRQLPMNNTEQPFPFRRHEPETPMQTRLLPPSFSPQDMANEMFSRMLERMRRQAEYLFEASEMEEGDEYDEYELEDDEEEEEEGFDENSNSEEENGGEGVGEDGEVIGSPRRRAGRPRRIVSRLRLNEAMTMMEEFVGTMSATNPMDYEDTGNNAELLGVEQPTAGSNRRPRSNSESLVELYNSFRQQARRLSSSISRRMNPTSHSTSSSAVNTPTTPHGASAFYFLGEQEEEGEGGGDDDDEEEDEWEDVDEDEEDGDDGGADSENPMVD